MRRCGRSCRAGVPTPAKGDCGENGGLVIAPNNVVQPDVPLENLLAVYETVREEL